jgi:tape measure domain-containing protein
MSMNVQIKIDAPQALPTIASVEAALTKVEAKGPAVGNAISDGLTKGAAAADKAKQSTESLTDRMAKLAGAGKAFGGLEDAFKREADLLEKIKGPAREYEADLRALDMLLQKNTISTKEYADQVANLNHRIGERPTAAVAAASPQGESEGGARIEGNIGSVVAGQFGELGSAFEGLATKGAVEAAALAGIAIEAVHLGDEYIKLQNSALRYAGSMENVDSALTQQMSLSRELHGGLEQTLELSTIVKERTEDMGLSASETAKFTKELGQAAVVSGHSLEDASGVINRLSFALESGLPAGRDMKAIMREYPAIADALTEHIGRSKKEIVEMANKGKLSLDTLKDSLDGVSGSLQDKMDKRVETTGQQWQHFKDELVLTAGKLVEQSGLMTAFGAILKVVGGALDFVITVLKGVGMALAKLHEVLGSLGSMFAAAGAAAMAGLAPILAPIAIIGAGIKGWGTTLSAISDYWNMDADASIRYSEGIMRVSEESLKVTKAFNEQADAIQRDYESHTELFEGITRVSEAMANGKKIVTDSATKYVEATKKVDAYGAAVQNIKTLMADLKAHGMADPTKALNAGDIGTIRAYQDAQRDLADQGSRYGGVLSEIHKKEDDRMRGIADLNGALKAGEIDQREYAEAMKQYASGVTAALTEDQKILEKIKGPMEEQSRGIAAIGRLYGEGKINLSEYNDELERLYKLTAKPPTSIVDKLGYAVAKPDLGTPRSAGVPKSDESVVGGKESLKAYFADQERINEAQATGKLSAAGLALSLQDLHDKYDDMRSPLSKMADGVALVKEKLENGIYTFDEAERALRQLRMAAGTGTFGDGIADGLEKIKKSTIDTASTISSAMKSAFDGINQNIVDMVTTGTADWGKLMTTIEGDIAKIALQTIEKSAIDGLSSNVTDAASGVAAGVTTGETASAAMLSAAPGIGAIIGTSAAALMQAGAAAAGATQGVTSAGIGAAIAGSWSGSNTLIHAANGYSAKVGGSAGVDTKLFAAMVSPGETVSIRTPEQRAAEASGKGAPSVKIINQHDTRGELAASLGAGEHDVAIMNVMKRNKGMVQAMLRK